MKHLSTITKISFIISLVSILAGCWDKAEVETKAFVIGIGLDKAEEKGKVEVTYIIANPEVGTQQSGGSSTEAAKETITIRASDFISARNSANSVIARETSYDLLRVILVSEELAKEKDFIRWIYDAEKDREIKRNVKLIITKEKVAEYVINNKPRMETRPHKFYQNMIERGIKTGMIPDSEIHEFFKITEEDANMFLAIYSTTETADNQPYRQNETDFLAGNQEIKGKTNTTQLLGSAAFLEGQMIGTLTGVENRISMLLNESSKASDILTTIPDPFDKQYQMTLRIIQNKKSKVKMQLSKSRPQIDVTLPLVLAVLTDPSMTNYPEHKQKTKELRLYLEKYIEERITEFVKKTQEEFKAEPFGWSLFARKEFSTLREYMDFDWMKSYPEMEINIDVQVTFGEFGRQAKVPTYQGIRD